MFGNKNPGNGGAKTEKLPGPKEIPGPVQNHLTNERKIDPDLVRLFKAVVKKRQEGKKAFDIRIFDDADAAANKIQVKDYTSLDDHSHLILYDGWFDEASKQVELAEKKKIDQDVTLFSQDEIQQKIEGLTDPDGAVFFYLARGPGNGGPLGRGAAVIKLTPQVPGKKQKKYLIYTADVVNMQPAAELQKLFDSDKAKDIAKWIKDAHHKRLY